MSDLDRPPASDDDVVQNFLDTKWREAVRGVRDAAGCVRSVYPELVQHLPETAARDLSNALVELENALRKLHHAGPHVLGSDAYEEYVDAQTRRQIEG
jgi:hypothetical protein